MDCSALSPSRISTYKDCEFKYFLTYHLRLPEARESNIYGLKGTAAHQALEYYANAIKEGNEDAEDRCLDYTQTLKDFYQETQLWTLDDREGYRKDGTPKGWPHPVEKFCESCEWATKDSRCSIAGIPYKKVEGCPKPNFEDDLHLVKETIEDEEWSVLDREILGTEVEFCLELEGGAVVRGVIDLVTKDGAALEIIDYKSGNYAKGYDAARKDPQMRIYSMVAKILWEEYGTYLTSLYYIRKKKYTTCIFSEEDDKATLKAVTKYWNEIKENTNPRRPNSSLWLCNFCVGHDVCGQIQKNHTENNRFVLPTINCAYNSTEEQPCWGGLAAENPEAVTAFNTHKMTYACAGHIELYKGGEYVSRSNTN